MIDVFNECEGELFMKDFINTELKNAGYFELNDNLEKLTLVQKVFAEQFTFENLDVLLNNNDIIDKQFLINKLFVNKRGSLCYELNGALYLVLKELGFDVIPAVGSIWTGNENGFVLDRSHTIVLYYQEDQLYLLDSGTGINLAIEPLPLDGEAVSSPVGKFRLRTKDTEKGSMAAEVLTEQGWVLRCAFYPTKIDFYKDLNRIKRMIHEHPKSSFRDQILIARSLPDGTATINHQRLSRKWINKQGLVEREERTEFKDKTVLLQAVDQYASKSTYQAVEEYLEK